MESVINQTLDKDTTNMNKINLAIKCRLEELIKGYNKDVKQIKRAKFSAITNHEIKSAFDPCWIASCVAVQLPGMKIQI